MQTWIWQQKGWPDFIFDQEIAQAQEKKFIENSGYILGAYQHISIPEQEQLRIELYSDEAVESSAIEGEILNRDSVQLSLRRDFGIERNTPRIPAPEKGISQVMVSAYQTYEAPLSHEMLLEWHLNLLNYRADLDRVGEYRSHDDPMQIISGHGQQIKVHYEAPPSIIIKKEMDRYITWFNQTKLSPLTKAAIAHLYFELVHPFEDGNGRLGRVLAEKSLSQSLKRPVLLALSPLIQRDKKTYYNALAANNQQLDINSWLVYFADLVLSAQEYAKQHLDFIIYKTKFYDKFKDQLNERQAKVIAKLFRAGLHGFEGGLSAENYIAITQTSRATATRDLQALVKLGALNSKGQRKATRYYLKFNF